MNVNNINLIFSLLALKPVDVALRAVNSLVQELSASLETWTVGAVRILASANILTHLYF